MTSRQGTVEKRFEVPAARKWTVNFLSHSHQDIGYTHRQMDVMKLQWRNLERAMDLAERTKDYPEAPVTAGIPKRRGRSPGISKPMPEPTRPHG